MTNIFFVDIGFSNYVEAGKILSVDRPDSSPMKRMIQHAKETHHYLDLTQGKKTRSIIVQKSESGLVLTASSVQTTTIHDRIKRAQQGLQITQRVNNDIIEVTSTPLLYGESFPKRLA